MWNREGFTPVVEAKSPVLDNCHWPGHRDWILGEMWIMSGYSELRCLETGLKQIINKIHGKITREQFLSFAWTNNPEFDRILSVLCRGELFWELFYCYPRLISGTESHESPVTRCSDQSQLRMRSRDSATDQSQLTALTGQHSPATSVQTLLATLAIKADLLCPQKPVLTIRLIISGHNR